MRKSTPTQRWRRNKTVHQTGATSLISLPALCSAYFFFNCSTLPAWRWTAGAFCFFAFGFATTVFMLSRYRREIIGFSKIRRTFFAALLVTATGLALKFVVVPLSAATTPLTGSAFVLYVGYRVIFSAIFALALTLSASVMTWLDLAYLLTLALLHASGFGWVHRISGQTITILNWSWQIWNASLFLLFGLLILSPGVRHGFLMRQPTFSKEGSVRVVLTLAVFFGTLLMIVGLLHTGVFIVGDGVRLSSLLAAVACTWSFAACLGLAVAQRLRAVRAQMISGLHDGQGVAEETIDLGSIFLSELRGWLSAYNRVVAKSNMLARKVAEQEGDVALSKIAAQVSHDIRSPLAALSMLADNLSCESDGEHVLFRQAVKRIEGIADDLVEKKRIKSSSHETVMTAALIRQIVAEKMVLLREKKHPVYLEALVSAASYGLFVGGSAAHLKRVISNLLNNALEAVSQSSGAITISTERCEGKVMIRVADNGPGMPDEVLARLGERGATFSKPGGQGLGLYHAINTIKMYAGELKFKRLASSQGTVVEIVLPEAVPPAWFVRRLRLCRASTVIVLDDDPTVHGLWRRRFEGVAGAIIGVSSAREFDRTLCANSRLGTNDLLLVDYDLKDSEANGMEIIGKIRRDVQKILVTSHHEDQQLQSECQRQGIKILPKMMAGWIPISGGAIFE